MLYVSTFKNKQLKTAVNNIRLWQQTPKKRKNKTQLPKKHKTKPNIFSTMQLFVLARRLFMQSTLNSRYLILLHT